MAKVTSCGIVMLNTRRELFTCHATGTARWDLPKGLAEASETALQTAVREAREETSLHFDPATLEDLGLHEYLPAKQLHLFAVRVASDAFSMSRCRCSSTFVHRTTGLPTLEVDAYAWQALEHLDKWSGTNMRRVLRGLDWRRIERLPEVAAIPFTS